MYIELGAAEKERRRTEDGREGTRGGWGREGARGWSEEVMMRGSIGRKGRRMGGREQGEGGEGGSKGME